MSDERSEAVGAEVEFSGPIWEWRGPAPHHFVSMPEGAGEGLRERAVGSSYGWGNLPVTVRAGRTEWTTSLFRRDGRYVVPIRDSARHAEGLAVGDTVTLRVTLRPRSGRPRPPKARRPSNRLTPSRPGPPIAEDELTIVPANEARWEDLRAIFEESRGAPALCWCQRFRMVRRESWTSVGAEELSARLRAQTGCADADSPVECDSPADVDSPADADGSADLPSEPGSGRTTGLVAYLDGEPVGWCAVAPRADQPRLRRDCRVPWLDRSQDKADPTVWAITCFVTRPGYRRRGVSRALARTAVDYAEQCGAAAVEGYPDLVEGGFVGARATFAEAGMTEVTRPTNRRAVMRLDFTREEPRSGP